MMDWAVRLRFRWSEDAVVNCESCSATVVAGTDPLPQRWARSPAGMPMLVLRAVAVPVVAVAVAACGGGSAHVGGASQASQKFASTSATPTLNPLQACAKAWNSLASSLDRASAATVTGGSGYGQAAAGYEVSDPSDCLITAGDASSKAFLQFAESDGTFQLAGSGAYAELPGNWVWSASVTSHGYILPVPTPGAGTSSAPASSTGTATSDGSTSTPTSSTGTTTTDATTTGTPATPSSAVPASPAVAAAVTHAFTPYPAGAADLSVKVASASPQWALVVIKAAPGHEDQVQAGEEFLHLVDGKWTPAGLACQAPVPGLPESVMEALCGTS